MEKKDVGYLFALAYNMGEGASLTLSGNFETGAEAAFMNKELDKCYSVMERQRAKVTLEANLDKLRMEEKQLEQIKDQINEMNAAVQTSIDTKKRPNDASLNAVKTLIKNQEITEYNIEQGKLVVEKLKKLIGK